MTGNYYMGMAGQRSYNTPNPQNFNYPKLNGVKGNQYSTYPKFKEVENHPKNEQPTESANLAKELEKQIKELQKLTQEAKDLAKKKLLEEKEKTLKKENENAKSSLQKNNSNKRLRKSNLDEIQLESAQKNKFDESVKNIISKLDKLS